MGVTANMIRNTLVFAALAAAGPCKPGRSSTELPSTTIESAETSYITESASLTSSAPITTTTGEVSTTSVSEPSGEDYIFQISHFVREVRPTKRDLHFVGADNPTDCTSATVYRLESGQLLEGGEPFYYTGQEYQEFGALGEAPANAPTTTFSIVGGKLAWTNDAFENAAFCQDTTDGKVYIGFTSHPVYCQSVWLLAVKAADCHSQASSTIVAEPTEASTVTEGSTESASTTEGAGPSTYSENASSMVDTITSAGAATTAETITTSGAESTTTAVDICVQRLISPGGEPRLTSRMADCEDLNRVTVSSYEVTQTVYKRGNVIIIPTNAIKRRDEGDEATTILPTATPDYATYCDSPTAYYDACSSLGITAFTTTIPEPTTTEVITTE